MIISKIIITITSIFFLIYLALSLDSEYIAAVLITFSEKTLGKDAEFTRYLTERTHRELYSPLKLLEIESNRNINENNKLTFNLNDTKVNEKTIFLIDEIDNMDLNKIDKIYYKKLNLALLNLRFSVINNAYINNKDGAMFDVQKLTLEYASKPHSCLDTNLTTKLVYKPIFDLSKNIAVYTDHLSTAAYNKELDAFESNKKSYLDLPIVNSALASSLILTRNITGTCKIVKQQ